MYRLCINIGGVKHCFDIPVQINEGLGPPSPNFPELELALAALELVEKVRSTVGETELTRSITDASTRFIQHVQKELPKGVELTNVAETTRRAA